MKKLYKDILELKTWIREDEGITAEGQGMFGKIHSEKQLLDLIYKFNKEQNKNINILWFNQKVEIVENKILAHSKVIITNGEETIEEHMIGLGEEKRKDISFGLGKALTYGKRFWLQKFLDLSSDNIDPEHISNEDNNKSPLPQQQIQRDPNAIAYGKTGNPITSLDKVNLTNKEVSKVFKVNKLPWELNKEEIDNL